MADSDRYSSLPDMLSDVYAGITTPVNAFNATVTGPVSDAIGRLIQKGTQRKRDPNRDTNATADDFATSMDALARLKRFIPGLGNGPGPSANAGAAGMEQPESPDSPALAAPEDAGPGWDKFMRRVAARDRPTRFELGPAAKDTITMLPKMPPAAPGDATPGAPAVPPTPVARARAAVAPVAGNGAPAALGPIDGLTAQIPGEFGAPEGGALSVAAPAAAPASRTLAQQYRDRLSQLPDATAELSPAQKAKLQLDFFLRLMSGGSKPGARSVGVIGDAGLATSAEQEALLDKARGVAEKRRAEARDDAFREIGFADKESDNARADRHLQISDQDRKDRTDLLRRQIDAGKWRVLDNGKTGTYVLFDQESGQTKDTGIKVYRETKDTRPAEIQLLEYLQKNPKAIDTMAQVTTAKDKGTPEKDPTAKIVDQAIKLVGADIPGKTTFDQAVRTVTKQYGGKGLDVPQTISRKSAEYQEGLKHPKVAGDKTKLDAVLKANGITITD